MPNTPRRTVIQRETARKLASPRTRLKYIRAYLGERPLAEIALSFSRRDMNQASGGGDVSFWEGKV